MYSVDKIYKLSQFLRKNDAFVAVNDENYVILCSEMEISNIHVRNDRNRHTHCEKLRNIFLRATRRLKRRKAVITGSSIAQVIEDIFLYPFRDGGEEEAGQENVMNMDHLPGNGKHLFE
jgi:hypothetical protein